MKSVAHRKKKKKAKRNTLKEIKKQVKSGKFPRRENVQNTIIPGNNIKARQGVVGQ